LILYIILIDLFFLYFQIRYFRLVYENLDADSNGSLNAEEVREALQIIVDTTLTDEEFQLIFGQMDRNQNGTTYPSRNLKNISRNKKVHERSKTVSQNAERNPKSK